VSLDRFNPVRGLLLAVGTALARAGLIDRERVVRATDLAWPRIVTGLARMSKSTVDVAMVGTAIGSGAIAGLGYAAPYWGLAFALGGGVAGGTIGMVSQRFGVGAHGELGATVRASALLAVAISAPLTAVFWLVPGPLIDLIGSGEAAVEYGTDYLRIVGLGVPLAALSLIGSRTLVGADDAWTPMVIRAGGAVANVALNVAFIFGLEMGVVGAAAGTVLANLLVVVAFGVGLARGGLPAIGEFPIRISLGRPWIDRTLARDLLDVAVPLVGTNLANNGAKYPKLAIISTFGPDFVAAYVVAMRVRMLMDTPNWGFSLASSSLVGQELGTDDEAEADAWARDVLRFCLATYVVIAAGVFAAAEPIGRVFVDDPAVLPTVTVFIWAAAVSVVFNGLYGGATGPLRASGDTRWPFYAQLTGRYLAALPVAFLGVVTPLGATAVYAAVVVEMAVPALVVYHRYRSGTWMVVSRDYRPDAATS